MEVSRYAQINRMTKETDIALSVDLEGSGICRVETGIGFFDHMLNALARFALVDLQGSCTGDLYVDGHHTVEDMGICLGQAIAKALGDKQGICRLGRSGVPMDEALVQVTLDISGRGMLVFRGAFPTLSCGEYDTQLTEEFFRAVAHQAGITLHMEICYGKNSHHITEALFKAFGDALRQAVTKNPRITGVQSTKGML